MDGFNLKGQRCCKQQFSMEQAYSATIVPKNGFILKRINRRDNMMLPLHNPFRERNQAR